MKAVKPIPPSAPAAINSFLSAPSFSIAGSNAEDCFAPSLVTSPAKVPKASCASSIEESCLSWPAMISSNLVLKAEVVAIVPSATSPKSIPNSDNSVPISAAS